MMKVKNIQSETAMEQHSESAVSNQFEPTCHSEHSSLSDVCSSSTAFGLAARSNGARMKRASGFTLIEVMVVIVILGVLAALIVPNVMGRSEKAKIDTTQIALKGVAGALDPSVTVYIVYIKACCKSCSNTVYQKILMDS
jgi:general secretion pathway protein G